MEKIYVTKSSMPPFEEYIEQLKPLWDSRWLSNRGSLHIKLEDLLKEKMSVENISLFANGHVALEVAINAFEFPLGGEVVTTPYTHCSTTHSIVRNGLKPVFCDVNPKDFTIDSSKIESCITEKTVAIVATHVYGYICDVQAIDDIAKKHNLKVIYDAAHAFDVKVGGKSVACYGDAVMFSCHATKVFHTIEGGIVVFKDASINQKVQHLINFGFNGPEQVDYISTNARMNEFEAAMGICNLKKIEEEIAKRKLVSDTYTHLLKNHEGIFLIQPQKGVEYSYSYFPVFFYGYRKTRDKVQRELAENNIYARKYFYPLISELNCYKTGYLHTVNDTPVAKLAADSVLSLPLYADLSIEEVEYICRIILK